MAMSDAQRRANRKWDQAHNTVLSCKLRKEEAELFKRACRENGTSPNAVFLAALRDFLGSHPVSSDAQLGALNESAGEDDTFPVSRGDVT